MIKLFLWPGKFLFWGWVMEEIKLIILQINLNYFGKNKFFGPPWLSFRNKNLGRFS